MQASFPTKNQLKKFYNEEIKIRKLLRFPPFIRLIRLVFRGKNKEKTFNSIVDFSKLFNKYKRAEVEILGPVECPLAIISGNFRFHIIFRSCNFKGLHTIIRNEIEHFKLTFGIYMEIDVDPQALL